MKICQKCNINKIKNSYQQCYTCNIKDDTASEQDFHVRDEGLYLEKEITHAREPIPKCVRNALLINFF